MHSHNDTQQDVQQDHSKEEVVRELENKLHVLLVQSLEQELPTRRQLANDDCKALEDGFTFQLQSC